MYLLDTNTVINYLGASMPPTAMLFMHGVVDTGSNISVVTKMEALGYSFVSPREQGAVETFVDGSAVLPINDDIVDGVIALRRAKKIKLPDAIIAATALVYGFILISRNTADFRNIPGLQVINPWEQ